MSRSPALALFVLVRNTPRTKEGLMRPGTYRDVNGVLVTVARTATGYSLTYPDGTVTMIGAAS